MRIRNLVIVLLFLLQAPACTSVAQPAPKNLDEVFKYIDNNWDATRKTRFKNLKESEATASEHFGMGLWIRNNWIRGNRDPLLVDYFKSIGLYGPDDISGVIILSYHRKLNNKPLNISAQVAAHTAYWKKISDCKENAKNIAIELYDKHKVGDLITIRMPVHIGEDGSKNAILYECPSPEWTFDPGKDLEVKGTITEKYNINSPSNVFFKVRIDRSNIKKLTVLGSELVIGKELDFQLEHLKVE